MFKRLAIFTFITTLILSSNIVFASTLSARLKGRILLQVESKGEAWYVNPADEKRYYLGRPDDAFAVMRDLGIGISNVDLSKIASTFGGTDKIDLNFSKTNAGKIFLQVESHGEAWYVNPVDLKRYYLGRPIDAFNIMRSLGLGISNSNLEQIVIANYRDQVVYGVMEKKIHDLINQERTKQGLNTLKWNDELAFVARKHSKNLAIENIPLIKPDIKCNLPIIHHEGLDLNFGLYASDRLKSSKVYYLNANAENIALLPIVSSSKYYVNNTEQTQNDIVDCEHFFYSLDDTLKQDLASTDSAEEKIKIINDNIAYRIEIVNKQSKIDIFESVRKTDAEVEQEAVVGWMNSPGHRKNILTSGYDEAGVGVAEVEDYFIITQVFITRAGCGYQTGPCCEKEGYYPYCYMPFNCENMVCIE